MNTFLALAICFSGVGEFTLRDLVSLEKLEHGKDAERLSELDKALQNLPEFRFTPTPDEFRIVAQGLRHEDVRIQAASAALLEKLSSQSTQIVASRLVQKRKDQVGSEIDDETWFHAVYYLVHRSEIRGVDAFQAFQKHFKPHRCNTATSMYRYFRPEFELSSHLDTRDLATLNYAMSRQINMLENPPSLEFNEDDLDRLTNIAEHCPDPRTSELARVLREKIIQVNSDR